MADAEPRQDMVALGAMLERIEHKLDTLIAALVDEEEETEPETTSLDGAVTVRGRNQLDPL